MEKAKDSQELWLSVKRSNLEFNKEEFIEHAKIDIVNLHELLRKDVYESSKINCLKSVTEEMLKDKGKFRLTIDIDHVSIQYIEIRDYIEDDDKYIKLYMSIYFYDNARNNSNYIGMGTDKYWNDIWIVTYKKKNVSDGFIDFNCDKCGANMNYMEKDRILKCDYCGNTKHFSDHNQNWVISNIEVND